MTTITLSAYYRLMRLDKPIGTLLLLWPTLWALWFATHGIPEPKNLLVFMLGVIVMRSAGCVINDYADRQIDGHVTRTKKRPLPNGEVTEKEAKILFLLLILFAFALVLTLNVFTIGLSVVAVLLAVIYPFMKRFTYFPQVVLGLAFSWAIPMAYAASQQALPWSCWLLLLANICWTIAYDTQYAMVDREDDLKIGVKSLAILFGRFDRLMIGILQFLALIFLSFVGYLQQIDGIYYCSLLIVSGFFAYQHYLIAQRQPDACFIAFMNNNYVGIILFVGIFLALL